MISFASKQFLFLFFVIAWITCNSQDTSLLWQHQFNANYKINYRWKLNFEAAFRSTLAENLERTNIEFDSEFFQFAANASTNLGFYSDLGFGVMYRFNKLIDDQTFDEIRFTQQYVYARRFNSIRILNRLKIDQRIFELLSIWRFRYRLSADFPLNGSRLDVKEFYMVLSTESLLNCGTDVKPFWDQRLTSAAGYQLSEKIKLEGVLEFRWEGYNRNIRRRTFLYTKLIFAMN